MEKTARVPYRFPKFFCHKRKEKECLSSYIVPQRRWAGTPSAVHPRNLWTEGRGSSCFLKVSNVSTEEGNPLQQPGKVRRRYLPVFFPRLRSLYWKVQSPDAPFASSWPMRNLRRPTPLLREGWLSEAPEKRLESAASPSPLLLSSPLRIPSPSLRSAGC